LFGRFPKRENDFGKTLPHRAVMIDAREADVFERPIPDLGEESRMRVVDAETAFANSIEERPQLGRCHAAISPLRSP
jgi:hypothetical protein